MKVYLISALMLAVLSCNNKISPTEVAKTAETNAAVTETLPECLAEFATLGEVLAQDGTIVKITDQLMIAYGTSSRCIPCNLPAQFKEGDRVNFSGNVKQAPNGVRMAGTPMCLLLIEKI